MYNYQNFNFFTAKCHFRHQLVNNWIVFYPFHAHANTNLLQYVIKSAFSNETTVTADTSTKAYNFRSQSSFQQM